ncbi:MAG: hypothetical protein WC421_02115 [Elusimicrobiales bacterium]
MRKIRRFKLPVHQREIYRRAARLPEDLAAAGLSGERELFDFVDMLSGQLEPGAVFDSFPKTSDLFFGLDIPGNRMFSAAIITLGPKLEAKIAALEPQPARKIAAIAAFELMECAVDLMDELVGEEAAKENFTCETREILMEPSLPANVPADGAFRPRFMKNALLREGETRLKALAAVLDALQAQKISVFIADGQPSPMMTAAMLIPWTPKKKRKGK